MKIKLTVTMMNKLIVLTAFLLFLAPMRGVSQQAKAYEMVYFKARAGNMVFKLEYADGYIGASKIKLKQGHQKLHVFLPESGTTDSRGSFIMHTKSGGDKQEITLNNIDPETEAPNKINAVYTTNGRNVKITFTKVNP